MPSILYQKPALSFFTFALNAGSGKFPILVPSVTIGNRPKIQKIGSVYVML